MACRMRKVHTKNFNILATYKVKPLLWNFCLAIVHFWIHQWMKLECFLSVWTKIYDKNDLNRALLKGASNCDVYLFTDTWDSATKRVRRHLANWELLGLFRSVLYIKSWLLCSNCCIEKAHDIYEPVFATYVCYQAPLCRSTFNVLMDYHGLKMIHSRQNRLPLDFGWHMSMQLGPLYAD